MTGDCATVAVDCCAAADTGGAAMAASVRHARIARRERWTMRRSFRVRSRRGALCAKADRREIRCRTWHRTAGRDGRESRTWIATRRHSRVRPRSKRCSVQIWLERRGAPARCRQLRCQLRVLSTFMLVVSGADAKWVPTGREWSAAAVNGGGRIRAIHSNMSARLASDTETSPHTLLPFTRTVCIFVDVTCARSRAPYPSLPV